MNTRRMGLLTIVMLVVSFALGYIIASGYKYISLKDLPQKPVVNVKQNQDMIKAGTQIVYEKEYTRCHHVVISNFTNQQQLVGKTLKELQSQYTPENGFRLTLYDEALVIRQKIDDWCPADKKKCRLKEFNGMVAIYVGPDSKNDSLKRVTGIKFASLPQNLQKSILEGKYEFDNEQDLNDALENLDEYL